jgi:DNA-binding beta-propeller fold protein YncE
LFGKEPAQGMLSPIAVCTDGGNRLFVVDSNAQLLHVFDLDTREYQRWQPPADVARFSQPVAVAFDAGGGAGSGRVLVSDPMAGVIFAFDRAGMYLGTLGGGKVGRPCGIAVGPDGRIFVSDVANHRVVVLTRDGESSAILGRRGSGPGEFNFPTYLAVDGRGLLYVSDSLNFRVQVFDGDLHPVRQIGRKGDLPGYFAQPKGLAVDAQGHLFVVDAHFEAVQVFDRDGALLMSFGREGHGPGEFWLPAGVCADPTGRIWVADGYNRRVQAFRTLGTGETP